jgi:hypothetical protein
MKKYIIYIVIALLIIAAIYLNKKVSVVTASGKLNDWIAAHPDSIQNNGSYLVPRYIFLLYNQS